MRSSGGHLDLDRCGQYGAFAQFFALWYPKAEGAAGSFFHRTHKLYDFFRRQLEQEREGLALCQTAAQQEDAWKQGKVAAFLSVEGAELLDCDPGRLEEAHQWGVRSVNLTWNHPNLLSGTAMGEPDRGLSKEGRDFVRRLRELHMLADLSHLSERGFWDVAELAAGPLFASHSNARSRWNHPRNLTDRQFRAIMETSGVAGLNLYADFLGEDPDVDTALDHVEHFLDMGGEKHVALGCDLDGCDRLPRGIAGVQDLWKLAEGMERRGWKRELIDDIFCRNLMGVVNRVCIM